MPQFTVNIGDHYPVYIEPGKLKSLLLAEIAERFAHRLVLCVDHQLAETLGHYLLTCLQQAHCDVSLLVVTSGELHKTRDAKCHLENQLFELGCNRGTCLIAVGGGMVLDLVGFVAATFCRGIPVVYVPTTLLAMVDACIGGKTAVNTPYGKNLVGAFYQPSAVVMDPNVLTTLPKDEWRNGYAEMLKHGLTADKNLFQHLADMPLTAPQFDPDALAELIYQNGLIKKQIVEQDVHDCGLRQLLNFGHTIGHALETVSVHHIKHGDAVAMGMLLESYLAMRLGVMPEPVFTQISHVLERYQFPKPATVKNSQALIQCLHRDKKASAHAVKVVLLQDIGKPHYVNNTCVTPVSDAMLKETFEWAEQALC